MKHLVVLYARTMWIVFGQTWTNWSACSRISCVVPTEDTL